VGLRLTRISHLIVGEAKEGRGFSPAVARLAYTPALAAVAACGRKLQRRRDKEKLGALRNGGAKALPFPICGEKSRVAKLQLLLRYLKPKRESTCLSH